MHDASRLWSAEVCGFVLGHGASGGSGGAAAQRDAHTEEPLPYAASHAVHAALGPLPGGAFGGADAPPPPAQSVQSVPGAHMSYSDPGPPSSQSPSSAALHVSQEPGGLGPEPPPVVPPTHDAMAEQRDE
jgi:hypothetical protein